MFAAQGGHLSVASEPSPGGSRVPLDGHTELKYIYIYIYVHTKIRNMYIYIYIGDVYTNMYLYIYTYRTHIYIEHIFI